MEIIAALLFISLIKQHKCNQMRLAKYNPYIDRRFEFLALHGLCYVYEPDFYKEVMFATKVIRSQNGFRYVPIHIPIFLNSEED